MCCYLSHMTFLGDTYYQSEAWTGEVPFSRSPDYEVKSRSFIPNPVCFS